MKMRLVWVVLVLMLASCSSHYCPTYGSATGSRHMSASAKKVKPSKGKKMAEKERMKFAEME